MIVLAIETVRLATAVASGRVLPTKLETTQRATWSLRHLSADVEVINGAFGDKYASSLRAGWAIHCEKPHFPRLLPPMAHRTR